MQSKDEHTTSFNTSVPPNVYWLLGFAFLLGFIGLSPLGLAFIVPSLSFIPLPFPWFYAGAACLALLLALVIEWSYRNVLEKARNTKLLHRAVLTLATVDIIIYAFLIPSSLARFH